MSRSMLNAIPPLVHILAGWLAPVWYYAAYDLSADFRVLAFCLFFSLLPDIDSHTSLLGALFPFISHPLEQRFGHRQITHSLFALGLVTAFNWVAFRDAWLLLSAAYLSHLVVDMLTGTIGVPLLWPLQLRFYIMRIRPKSFGEVTLGIFVAIALLTPLVPSGQESVASLLPQEDLVFEPTPTSLPTLTPHTVTIRIPNVYELEDEIMVEVGDPIERGSLVASLDTQRQLNAKPSATPTATPTLTPTLTVEPPPPTLHPVDLAMLENELNLARARYRSVIATTTPDAAVLGLIATRQAEAADRAQCLDFYGGDNQSDVDWRGWNCKLELERLEDQISQLRATAAPQSADPLTADIAYFQFQAAQLRYQQAVVQLTPVPTSTPSPPLVSTPRSAPTRRIPSQTPTPLVDHTQVRSLVSGRVLAINIVAINGNAATVEIVVLIDDSGAPTFSPSPLPNRTFMSATIQRVVDGDTIDVLLDDGREERIRLLGINTPETVHPELGEECFGPEASIFVKSLLPRGSSINIELDDWAGERDRYGRLLAHVWLPNGDLLNEKLLREGLAEHEDYGNPSGFQKQYAAAEQIAKAEQQGLWQACR